MQCSLADLDSIFTEPNEIEEIQVQPTIVQPTKLHTHVHRSSVSQVSKRSHKSQARQSAQSQQPHQTRKSHQGQASSSSFRQPVPPRQSRQSTQAQFREPAPVPPTTQFEFRQPLPRPHARQTVTSSPFRQPLPPAQLRQAYAIQPLRHVPMALIQQANYSRHSQQPQYSSGTQELQPPSRTPIQHSHTIQPTHTIQPSHILQPTNTIQSHQIQQANAIQQLQQQVQHALETQSQSYSSQQQPSCSTSNTSEAQQVTDISTQPILSIDDEDSQEFKFLNADEIFKGTVFDQLNSFDGEALDPFLEDDITAPSMSDDTTMAWETSNLFGDQDPDHPNIP